MGVSATQMEKKRIVTGRGNINREIKYQNMILSEISRRIKALLSWIRRIGLELSSQVQHRTKENFRWGIPAKTLSGAEI